MANMTHRVPFVVDAGPMPGCYESREAYLKLVGDHRHEPFNFSWPAEREEIWLAYEAWHDFTENKIHLAFGYHLRGFFSSHEEAEAWVNQGVMILQEDCWAVPAAGAPSRKIEKVKHL